MKVYGVYQISGSQGSKLMGVARTKSKAVNFILRLQGSPPKKWHERLPHQREYSHNGYIIEEINVIR